jgi:hypothetical protein
MENEARQSELKNMEEMARQATKRASELERFVFDVLHAFASVCVCVCP